MKILRTETRPKKAQSAFDKIMMSAFGAMNINLLRINKRIEQIERAQRAQNERALAKPRDYVV